FNGNESHFSTEYMNTFQLLNYSSAFTKASLYGILHFEHHLNGLITNRIPLFKRLNWNLLYGSNDCYVNSSTHHEEIFLGLENLLKVFRFDVVAGTRNGGKFTIDYRVGYGGLIGSSLNSSRFRGRR